MAVKTNVSATLTDREKLILVSLRKKGVDSAILSKAFGVSTGTIAAYAAHATMGNGIFA